MGLLQNSPNEKNEIDFPERGVAYLIFCCKLKLQWTNYNRNGDLLSAA
jgi:hypothetical protein